MANTNTRTTDPTLNHKWKFFRSGGFDQVRLDSGADLLALERLDQKLWAALSCPTQGVEFDAQTLAYLDSDKDGRIRVAEILAAVRWVGGLVKNMDDLVKAPTELPLAAINDATEEGAQLLASARQILANLGKPDATAISMLDTADIPKIFAKTKFNGDGIIALDAADSATNAVLKDIAACFGADTDRSGVPGVSLDKVTQFFGQLDALSAWWAAAQHNAKVCLPLGADTAAAYAAFQAVQHKIDDYFVRCQLAAFDTRSVAHLNRAEADYDVIASKELSAATGEIATFPLALVAAGRALPLAEGLNPAWVAPMRAFVSRVVEKMLGAKETLSEQEWTELQQRFAGYASWLATQPANGIAALGRARLEEIHRSDAKRIILDLLAQDKAVEKQAGAIDSVDKLVRYYCGLYTLLNNFVSFRDFYTRRAKAIFQAGTLYLDGRSCELCVRVEDMAKHGALANLSRTYLAYCECTRRGSNEKMTIAAAFTGGTSDNLMVGRNGVFYDRKGRDWDATIVKIIEHPISIRQAFAAPYKRMARMVSEQIEKFAAGRDKAMHEQAAAGIAEAAQKATEAGKPAAPPVPFDIAKFAGVFAAIGLAIGAIGTALASIATGFFALAWWQMPLAIVGLVLAISGPSMIMAWLKLRERNLAPILDANGWAVNTLAKINIAFGGALTALAKLPEGAARSLEDPYAEKRTPWKRYVFLLLLIAALAVLWQKGYIKQWAEKLQHRDAPAAATQ